MTTKEIRKKAEHLYNIILSAQSELQDLRKICKHKRTSREIYEHKDGTYKFEDVCNYCGELIYDN